MRADPRTLPCLHPGCTAMLNKYRRRKYQLCPKHVGVAIRDGNPDRAAKISRSLKRRYFGDLIFAQAMNDARTEGKRRKIAEDPAYHAHLRARGLELLSNLTPEQVEKRTARSRSTRLRHVPVDLRPEYARLRHTTSLPAAERARVVIEDAAVAARRYHSRGNG